VNFSLAGLGRGNISLMARLVLGSGLALLGCGAALLYSILRGEVADQRAILSQQLREEMLFALPAMSGPAVVGDYSVIEQMVKARARQPTIARFAWTDNSGHPVAALGPQIRSEAPAWFVERLHLPVLEDSQEVIVGGEKYGTVSLRLNPAMSVNKLWRGFWEKLGILFLGTALSLGVTLVLLRSGVQPLRALAASARRFGQGDYAVRISLAGPPETAQCIQAFNSMAENIESLLASLRRSEEKSRLLALQVEQSSDAIFSHDQSGVVTSWNRGATRLYGYSAAEAIGRLLRELDLWAGRGGPVDAGASDQRALPASFETCAKTKTGQLVEVSVVATPFRDEAGRPMGELTIVRDISALKQKEAAAEAANRAKSEFLATMSHEIRTPMNGVIGMTALLLDTPLTQEQRDYAETVHRSGEALLAIINDILDFSKIEAGRLELEPVPFALRETLAETIKTLASLAHAKSLELAYEIRPGVPDDLVGDTGRIGQILVNLVGNAIKFTEQGEVAVRVDTETVTADSVTLRVAVQDTGIGIAADKSRIIFDAFAQADASTTRRFGGTGLGLAICRRLVERMGGRIWLDSEPARGSTFHFTLSLERARVPVPRRVAAPSHALQGLPVLAADDNATNRRLLEATLAAWGVAPTIVEDGRAALVELERARAAGRTFDLVLLDARMPDLDGFAVAERIRREPALAGVTVMLLTSDVMSGDLARCRALGVARHLVKPFTPSELLNAVLLALGQSIEIVTPMSSAARDASAKRLHVLVAEDNAVNQRVIVRLLEKMGHIPIVAYNGQEAVDVYESRPFDVVLMDVQMPVMDGLAATKAIRESEARRPGRRRLPIMALTAYAMRGDRERCLAAGMDAYLTKPVKPEELSAALNRLLDPDHEASSPSASTGARAASSPVTPERSNGGGAPPERREREVEGSEVAPTSEVAPVVSGDAGPEAGFDFSAALNYVGGDRELLDELLGIFVEDAPIRMKAIRRAIADAEALELTREAHTLKGALKVIGAPTAAGLAQGLEALGHDGNIGEADKLALALEREMDRLLQSLMASKRG
jgi:two-component system, sensor histidine kinase and response regulator